MVTPRQSAHVRNSIFVCAIAATVGCGAEGGGLLSGLASQCIVAVDAKPSGGGTAIGGGTAACSASRTVIATPATGYTFVNWAEGNSVVSTSASYTFTASTDRALVANFATSTCTLVLSASPLSGGTVSGGGVATCLTPRTVTATAANGYTFVNWTEGGSVVSGAASSYTFTPTTDRTLTATFAVTNCTITASASPAAAGTVTGSGTAACLTARTVTATAAAGYSFSSWTEGSTVASTGASYTFTPTTDRTLIANFATSTCTIALSAGPAAGGTVSGSGAAPCFTSRTVTATAAAGYTFVNWTEGGSVVSGTASYTFTPTNDRTLLATFAGTNCTITVGTSPGAGGTVTGGGTAACLTARTVTASAAAGYSFTNWIEGSTIVSTSASYSFTPTTDRTLIANFSTNACTITLSANPTAGGAVSGGGAAPCLTSRTVTATAATGYTFVNWTESGSIVSTSASYSFAATVSRALVANFVAGGNCLVPNSGAGSVSIPQVISGALSTSDCTFLDGTYADIYKLTLSASKTVRLTLNSGAFDAYLLLFDANGSLISSDDNGGGGTDSRLIITVAAGTYYIAANSLRIATGSYQLTLSDASNPCALPASVSGSVVVPQTVSGTLTSTDCTLSDGTYADFYSLTLTAGTTVQFTLTSSAFDAYLALFDANGAVLSTDDNGAGGTNARITRAMTPGTYYMMANSAAIATGGYQLGLSVSTVPAPDPMPTSPTSAHEIGCLLAVTGDAAQLEVSGRDVHGVAGPDEGLSAMKAKSPRTEKGATPLLCTKYR